MKLAIILLFCGLLSQGVVCGQTAAGNPPSAKAERPLRFDLGDAAYWGGSIVDVSTSLGKREAGAFRDSDGRFAAGPNVAYKLGLWGGIKFLEYKYPERRRTFLWTKIGIGVTFGLVGLHNSRVKR